MGVVQNTIKEIMQKIDQRTRIRNKINIPRFYFDEKINKTIYSSVEAELIEKIRESILEEYSYEKVEKVFSEYRKNYGFYDENDIMNYCTQIDFNGDIKSFVDNEVILYNFLDIFLVSSTENVKIQKFKDEKKAKQAFEEISIENFRKKIKEELNKF